MLPQTGNPYLLLRDLYALEAKDYAARGDFEKAYQYSDSVHAVKDSLNSRRTVSLLAKAEKKVEVERHNSAVQQLEEEKRFNTFVLWSISFAVLLLVVIGVLVYNRQRLVYRQRQRQVYAEKLLAETELQLAISQLESFTRSIHEKNLLIEQIEAELELERSLEQEPTMVATSVKSNALQQLLQSTILTGDQWDSFRLLFDKVHRGFLTRLQEKFPNLTPAETRYVVLSKLNLSNKNMASMLGVQTDTMRLHRHRLRKKLNITDDGGLQALIAGV